MRLLIRFSRTCHKYLGLIGAAYFLLMALSGILLNHPDLIRGMSLPAALLPDSHTLGDGDTLIVGGRAGVWYSPDRGRHFVPLAQGYPQDADARDTLCLLHYHHQGRAHLLAGTRGGLFHYDFSGDWQKVPRPQDDAAVVALIRRGNDLLLFTEQQCLISPLNGRFEFRPQPFHYAQADLPSTVPLIRWLFALHSGAVLGLPGRLFVDVSAAILVFLSLSGLWLCSVSRRFMPQVPGTNLLFWWRNHLKLGIRCAMFLLLITLSGVVIRPPFSTLIKDCRISRSSMAFHPDDSRRLRIDRVALSADHSEILIATRDGLFGGPADLHAPLRRRSVAAPISAMGVNVLCSQQDGRWIIGSFAGLYLWDEKHRLADALITSASRRPLVTALIMQKNRPVAFVDYRDGAYPCRRPDTDVTPQPVHFPAAMGEASVPLRHILFELHNGRILRQWLGAWSMAFIPVGGGLLCLVLVSGFYDWWLLKTITKK